MGLDKQRREEIFRENSAEERKAQLKVWLMIIIIPIIVFAWFGFRALRPDTWNQHKNEEFFGTVQKVEPRRIFSRRNNRDAFTVVVKNKAGRIYQWPIGLGGREQFREGDYFIKLKGKNLPAVYRYNQQLVGSDFYLEEPVDDTIYRKMDVAPKRAKPKQAVVKSPPPPPTEERAKKLLAEASEMWKDGDQKEAISKCEEALAIRRQLYGDNHPLVAEIESKLKSARQSFAGF